MGTIAAEGRAVMVAINKVDLLDGPQRQKVPSLFCLPCSGSWAQSQAGLLRQSQVLLWRSLPACLLPPVCVAKPAEL